MRTVSRTIFLVCAVLIAPFPAEARSLAGKLHRFFDVNAAPTHGEFTEFVTPEIERQAIRGIDYPVTATSPGIAYTFNFETGTAERASESLGPVFVERADTVGQHRFDLGLSYLYGKLSQFDGRDLADLITPAGERTDPASGVLFAQAFAARHFSIESHVLSLSGTYGVTDRWDVNLLVPLVWTQLSMGGHVAAAVRIPGEQPIIKEYDAGLQPTAFGVGDLVLRTKYRFLEHGTVDAAGLLGIRVPTGQQRDFQGIGDTALTPSFVLSRAFGPHDVRASLGIEVNADDLQRCRARYAVGGSFQPWQGLAVLLDLLGSSSFVDDTFDVPGRTFRGGGNQQIFAIPELLRAIRPDGVTAFVPRSDLVDLAVGAKARAGARVIAFVTAFVPLTNEGLRPEVIPAGGVEYTF